MTSSSKWYISVRGGEVNVGVVWIVDTTTFAVWIISRSQLLEIASTPSIDADYKNDHHKSEEDDKTDDISAGALFVYVNEVVLGTTLLFEA